MAILSSNIDSSDSYNSIGKKRLVDPAFTEEDSQHKREEAIRPKSFSSFIGQSELKKILGISVQAALSR